MLPDAVGEEVEFPQPGVSVAVPSAVVLDLLGPKLGSCLRHDEVLGTAMPEATIDEDVQTDFGEYNVGSPTTVERQLMVHSEPQARSMQQSSERKLGCCVTAAVGLHRPTRGRCHRRVECRR